MEKGTQKGKSSINCYDVCQKKFPVVGYLKHHDDCESEPTTATTDSGAAKNLTILPDVDQSVQKEEKEQDESGTPHLLHNVNIKKKTEFTSLILNAEKQYDAVYQASRTYKGQCVARPSCLPDSLNSENDLRDRCLPLELKAVHNVTWATEEQRWEISKTSRVHEKKVNGIGHLRYDKTPFAEQTFDWPESDDSEE